MSNQSLAKVDDVIERGQVIPPNAALATDVDGDEWLRDREPDRWRCKGSTLQDRPSVWVSTQYGPLTVVEVDPEPQAAYPTPSGLCNAGANGFTCDILDPAHRRIYHPVDADGYLPLKGTATGDNQLDVPSGPGDREPDSREVADHHLMTALGVDRLDQVMPAIERLQGMRTAGEIDRSIVDRVADLLDVGSNEDIIGRLQYRLGEAAPVVDFAVPCRDEREPDGERCTGEIRYAPGEVQARCTVCRGWRGRYAPAESGPVVLSLPQVPDGAVALIAKSDEGDDVRFVRTATGWHRGPGDVRGIWSLADILVMFGPVTVEFAPPRKPRTWEQIDAEDPANLPAHVEVDGYGRWTWAGYNDGLYLHETFAFAARTLHALRQLGKVREVLTP